MRAIWEAISLVLTLVINIASDGDTRLGFEERTRVFIMDIYLYNVFRSG